MAQKDYYQILGIDRNSSPEDIKKAYRKLSKQHHPDAGGDEEQFKEISVAYGVLSDPEKKRKYDNGGFNINDFSQGFPNGFGGGFNVDDIFEHFMGGHRGSHQRQPQRGSDLRVKLTLNINEIFNGTTKKIKFRKEVICNGCGGTGAAKDSSVKICPTCNGAGFTQSIKQTIIGNIQTQETCRTCNGEGKVIQNFCPVCNGRKVTLQEETVELVIPRSVRTGDVLSFAGGGNASKVGGPNGNLLVIVEEQQNDLFYRQDSDLLSRYQISVYDAIFGRELEVDTVDGKIKINTAQGIQSGTRLRVEGKGLYKAGTNYRGDMFVDIIVYTPKDLNKEEKEIFEKIKDLECLKPKK